MAEFSTRFPVGIIHHATPLSPVGSEAVAVNQARALARAGYPVRLITGSRFDQGNEYISRTVSELSYVSDRVLSSNELLLRGESDDECEQCIQDIAQAIGRELVGCGSVFVHDIMTTHRNLAAAEAIRRLALGSRGVVAHGAPTRRWVFFANEAPPTSGVTTPKKKAKGKAKKKRAGSAGTSVLSAVEGARYVTPSETRKGELAKALKIPKSQIRVVPRGVDSAEYLDLTPRTRTLAQETAAFTADLVLLTPARTLEQKNLTRGLQIVNALSRARRGFTVRWLVTCPQDTETPQARRILDRLLFERERLGLRDSVRFISADFEWARPRLSAQDARSLSRLADAVFLPSDDEDFGLAALEGALTQSLLILGPARAFTELLPRKQGTTTRITPGETPLSSARKILKAVDATPSIALRHKTFERFSWDAIVRDHLVSLIEFD